MGRVAENRSDKEKLIFLYNCFQPNTLQEATVDPVHDDIEITREGEGTDAFAVSILISVRSHFCFAPEVWASQSMIKELLLVEKT